jgi:hypothetical protein
MNITEYISNYTNHPVLFIGSGFSFRYLTQTYTWNDLLSKVCEDLWGNDERYLDIKAKCTVNGICSFAKVASNIEILFNEALEQDRNGKFKEINDIFYDNMRNGITLSRFKIYIAKLVNTDELKEGVEDEISELKKARKNIGSIITTNYDKLTENIFEFNPLVGNDILLSNPYGSVYKIHGCVDDVSKIIITEEDYKLFDERYELIRAQMLSLFIHNPIIFLGYNIGDDNIKKVLKTIFSYIPNNTVEAEKVRKNFLLVEYEKGSSNLEITDHDIVINGSNIRINKLKTDDFLSLYHAIATISLPISAMDVRKVQTIVKEIYSGGNIKVMITENLDDMRNGDRILAIGSSKTIRYQFMTTSEMTQNYFDIIDESNSAILSLINKQTIADNQYFPIYGFSTICDDINNVDRLKQIQKTNVESYITQKCYQHSNMHNTICDINEDNAIAASYKNHAIMFSVNSGNIPLSDLENYLRSLPVENRKTTDYKRLLCLYDLKKYDV